MKMLVVVLSVLLVVACSEHKVDTFPEWCEQISGVDLEANYLPFWAVIFSVSYDRDAIRDDYIMFLDQTYLEKIDNRAPRMAWREGVELHLVNLSGFLMIAPQTVIGEWAGGVETAKKYGHEEPTDVCLYGTVTSLFDSLHIHSMEPDPLGINWTDSITVIDTGRTAL